MTSAGSVEREAVSAFAKATRSSSRRAECRRSACVKKSGQRRPRSSSRGTASARRPGPQRRRRTQRGRRRRTGRFASQLLRRTENRPAVIPGEFTTETQRRTKFTKTRAFVCFRQPLRLAGMTPETNQRLCALRPSLCLCGESGETFTTETQRRTKFTKTRALFVFGSLSDLRV